MEPAFRMTPAAVVRATKETLVTLLVYIIANYPSIHYTNIYCIECHRTNIYSVIYNRFFIGFNFVVQDILLIRNFYFPAQINAHA